MTYWCQWEGTGRVSRARTCRWLIDWGLRGGTTESDVATTRYVYEPFDLFHRDAQTSTFRSLSTDHRAAISVRYGGRVVNLQLLWQFIQLRLNRDEEGASLVEYALLVALIAVVCIAAIALIGNSASTKLSVTGASINSNGS